MYAPVAQEMVTIQDIIQTRQNPLPPPPPRPQIPVEVPNDVILEPDPLDFDAALNIDAPLPLPPPPTASDPENEDEDEIFVIVEEMPTIVGGVAALSADLEYPAVARRAGLEGTSVIQVLVDRDGTASNPVVIRSASTLLDNAATEAILSQQFTPGRQRGKAVLVRIAIPVHFKLRHG